MINDLSFKNIYEWPLKIQFIVFFIAFLLTFLIGYLTDVSSINIDLEKTKKKEEELKYQVSRTINKEFEARNEIADYKQIQSLVAAWATKFVRYDHLPELLNEILKIGGVNHLSFMQFKPGQAVKKAAYFDVPIEMVVQGGYHQIAECISQIANLSWIVKVGNFKISSADASTTGGVTEMTTRNTLSADIALDVYYLPENK